jgi:hypothetical protein
MKSIIEHKNRQLIPRWVRFDKFVKLNYHQDENKSTELISPEGFEFDQVVKLWKINKSVILAGELISFGSCDQSNPIIKEALDYLKNAMHRIDNPFIRDLINNSFEEFNSERSCYEPSNFANINADIAYIRKNLYNYPLNPIQWMDLAYCYTLKGLINKAEKCIKISLSLNNKNPFLLRSASRFFVHTNKPEVALNILSKSQVLPRNPLLISAEISIAEAFKIKSKFIKNGFYIESSGQFSVKELNELRATLGTLEVSSGSEKKGKKLINSALLAPNENTIAQVQYLQRRTKNSYKIIATNIPCNYEASAYNSYFTNDFDKSEKESEMWYNYQPFSSHSILINSFIKAVIRNNHREAIQILERSLISTHNNSSILNNIAFSYAKLNEVVKAEEAIKKIDETSLDPHGAATLTATKGLVEYRKGNYRLGENLYYQSIQLFKEMGNSNSAITALYFYCIEEQRLKKQNISELIKKTYEMAKEKQINDIVYLFENDKDFSAILMKKG